MSGGGSSGSSSNKFSREGTVETSTWRNLLPEHKGLFDQAFGAVAPPNAQTFNSYLEAMPGLPNGPTAYQGQLDSMVNSNLPGVSYPGQTSLAQQAAVNPFSNDYRNNTFDKYLSDTRTLLANVQSGPTMTRGGTAQSGFMQAQALDNASMNREQQIAQHAFSTANAAQGAARTAAGIENANEQIGLQGIDLGRRGELAMFPLKNEAAQLATQRAKMFADLVPTYTSLDTVMRGLEENSLSGQGAQSSSSVGWGVNLCCFIFLEAYNGALPWWVRACRDQYAPEDSDRRRGYVRMSRWLVPAMRVSKVVRFLVNSLMVKPLTKWGGWYKCVPGYDRGWVYHPVVKFWFKLWKLLGKNEKGK